MFFHNAQVFKKTCRIDFKPVLIIFSLFIMPAAVACGMPAAHDNSSGQARIDARNGGAVTVKSEIEQKADADVAVLLKAEEFDKAIEDARGAFEVTPSEGLREKLADAYISRAWFYKAKRLVPYALDDLTSARQVAPDYYRVYYELGRFYNNQMMQSTGVLELNKCIELMPGFAPAYNERSACESRIYRWEEALADAGKAIELSPKEALYYYTRSLAYRGMMLNQEAIADLEMALKLSQDAVLKEKAEAELKVLNGR